MRGYLYLHEDDPGVDDRLVHWLRAALSSNQKWAQSEPLNWEAIGLGPSGEEPDSPLSDPVIQSQIQNAMQGFIENPIHPYLFFEMLSDRYSEARLEFLTSLEEDSKKGGRDPNREYQLIDWRNRVLAASLKEALEKIREHQYPANGNIGPFREETPQKRFFQSSPYG